MTESIHQIKMSENHNLRCIVVGYPNVGKSTLIRKLTNQSIAIGNFHGTTVHRAEYSFRLLSGLCTIIDIPGISSLDYSDNNDAATIVLRNVNEFDVILMIVNGTTLDRDVKLVMRVALESQKPMVMVINMLDELKELGIQINTDVLSTELGIKSILISAKTNKNIDQLRKLLEESIGNHDVLLPCTTNLIESEVSSILERCITIDQKLFNRVHYGAYVDKFLMHPFYGMIALISIIFSMFYVVFRVTAMPMDIIMTYGAKVSNIIDTILPSSFFTTAIVNGAIPAIFTTLSFLPQIITLLFCTGILEKSGYIDRISYLLDKIMRLCGMDGRSVIGLISGFNCSLQAYVATRMIKSRKKRIITMFSISILPCSAKMIILTLLASSFFGRNAPYAMVLIYTSSITISVILSIVASKCISETNEEKENDIFAIELSQYRIPEWKILFQDAYIATISFLRNAGPLIFGMACIIWLLSHVPYQVSKYHEYYNMMNLVNDPSIDTILRYEYAENIMKESIIGKIGILMEPLFRYIGFDWKMNIALLSSLAAKEVIISTLEILYHTIPGQSIITQLTHKISFASGISFMIFIMLCMPCISAVSIFYKELQSKEYTLYMVTMVTISAWLISCASYQILS